MKMYRQGDVLLKETQSVPNKIKEKDRTVARGEATGHHHTFDKGARVMVDTNGRQFVQIQEQSTITHQEHAPLTLPKGTYEVVIQRELDEVEGTRTVMD